MPSSRKLYDWLASFRPMACGLGVVALLQLLAGTRYGLFRDELYYLSCAKSPAWGFVDHPPLSVWLLWAWTTLFGASAVVVRALSLLVSLLSVVAGGTLAKEMYDDPRTVALTTISVACMPVLRVVGTLYSPNTLEILLWFVVLIVWVRCMTEANISPWHWAGLGVLVGISILNRLSGVWLLGALAVATAVWDVRSLRKAWPTLGCALAVMCPWIIWQEAHHWATIEFVRNANFKKLLPVSPWQFVFTQLVVTNPIVSVVWISALIWGFRSRIDRALVVGFCSVAILLILNGRSRENYLAPAYAFILPVGAHILRERQRPLLIAIAASGVALGFVCLPILNAPLLAKLFASFPRPPSTEKGPKSVLQGLSDTIGWPELTLAAANAWHSLPVGERQSTAVLASNYGEAAAIEYYGGNLGLPRPICAHNEYWLRGPGQWDGKQALYVGTPPIELLRAFTSKRVIGRVSAPLAVPEEANASIWLLQGGHVPVGQLWTQLKRYE